MDEHLEAALQRVAVASEGDSNDDHIAALEAALALALAEWVDEDPPEEVLAEGEWRDAEGHFHEKIYRHSDPFPEGWHHHHLPVSDWQHLEPGSAPGVVLHDSEAVGFIDPDEGSTEGVYFTLHAAEHDGLDLGSDWDGGFCQDSGCRLVDPLGWPAALAMMGVRP